VEHMEGGMEGQRRGSGTKGRRKFIHTPNYFDWK
jgi:hypothetical protein